MLLKQDFSGATIYVLYKKKQKLSKVKFANRIRQIVAESFTMDKFALDDANLQSDKNGVLERANDCFNCMLELLKVIK